MHTDTHANMRTGTHINMQINSQSNVRALSPCGSYDAFIFDLDGTLIDSLPDLVVSANMALEEMGFPTRTRDEILSYVGDGGFELMRRACPKDTDRETVSRAFTYFKSLYETYGFALTKPYDGVLDALVTLRAHGKKLAILSNKFEQGVHDVVARYFDSVAPHLFDCAHGERESLGIPRKPDPKGLIALMEELGVGPKRCVYFGDSAGDITCAHAAGVLAVGCTWGYQSKEALIQAKADVLIDTPASLLDFV